MASLMEKIVYFRSCLWLFIYTIIIAPSLLFPFENNKNEQWISSAIENGNLEETETLLLAVLNGGTNQLPVTASDDELYCYLAEIQLESSLVLRSARGGNREDKKDILKMFDTAEQSALLSIDNNNLYSRGWKILGRIQMTYAETVGNLDALQKISAARDAFLESLRLNSNQSEVWGYLGDIYGNMPPIITFGNKPDAVSFARRSLILDKSGGIWPLYRLTKLLFERNWSNRKRQKAYKKGYLEWISHNDFINQATAFEFSDQSSIWFEGNFYIRFLDSDDKTEASTIYKHLLAKAEEAGIQQKEPGFYDDIIALKARR
jgi:hypothetical protein